MKTNPTTLLRAAAALLAAALPVAAAAAAETYAIDPAHTSAQFKVRHLMVSYVRGQFGKTTGAAQIDPEDLAKSSVEATIDASTIDTQNADRDKHLRSQDFLHAEKHPTITFRSTGIANAGEGKLRVTGDLTIRGVTKPVVLEVEGPTPSVQDPWGNVRRGLTATTTINRKDFGLAWNKALETGGVVVGDEVHITIDAELVKEAAPATAKGGEGR
jgi:polyisoprenoid-binding protein YceI